jgi:hypothetical protein
VLSTSVDGFTLTLSRSRVEPLREPQRTTLRVSTDGGPTLEGAYGLTVLSQDATTVMLRYSPVLSGAMSHSYLIAAAACNSAGCGPFSNTVSFTQPAITPPSNLTGTTPSSTSVTLSWTDSDNETSYLLTRASPLGTPGGFSTSVAANTNSFSDTGLIPGATYIYTLEAQVVSGEEVRRSASVSVTLVPGNTSNPSAPTVGTGTVGLTTRTSAQMRLDLVTPNGLSTDFWYEFGTDPALAGAQQTTPTFAGAGTYTIRDTGVFLTGLQRNTVYYARIVAANSAGTARGATITFRTNP